MSDFHEYTHFWVRLVPADIIKNIIIIKLLIKILIVLHNNTSDPCQDELIEPKLIRLVKVLLLSFPTS